MSLIYAMSDMHGDMEAFDRALQVVDFSDPENLLVLCGDYMPPPDTDTTMPRAIVALQEKYPDQVIALVGNHEAIYMEQHQYMPPGNDPVLDWMRKLPYYYETDTQIFIHAGVDEEAGDLWRYASENWFFCEKYPWSTGHFVKDVIAGHVGTHQIACDPNFHDIFWDGESHYYIDGTVHISHSIPVLRYDTELKRYAALSIGVNGSIVERIL